MIQMKASVKLDQIVKVNDYKNALIYILIKKARQYFEKGLTTPDKYVEMAKKVCEENDKF